MFAVIHNRRMWKAKTRTAHDTDDTLAAIKDTATTRLPY
jgi:hypothetical protein